MWPRDFLPEYVPGTRVLTYGYDSQLLYSESDSSVFDFGARLLEALKTARADESVCNPSTAHREVRADS